MKGYLRKTPELAVERVQGVLEITWADRPILMPSSSISIAADFLQVNLLLKGVCHD